MDDDMEWFDPPGLETGGENALKFTTYKNYLLSLANFIHSEFAGEPHCFLVLRTYCNDIGTEKSARNSKLSDHDYESIQKTLFNAWNTELVLRLKGTPSHLIRYANHWAPIQAYYAIYLCVRAYLKSSGASVPDTHIGSLKEMASQLHQRDIMPPFWNVTCSGGGTDAAMSDVIYHKLPARHRINKLNSLSNPQTATFWDRYGMLLRTTRIRQLDSRLEDKNIRSKYRTVSGEMRKRLKVAHKQEICCGIPPTTVFDFFYRLRIRSNYDDADAFLIGNLSERDAMVFHDAVTITTACTMFCLERLIAHRLGREKAHQLVKAFADADKDRLSCETVRERSKYWF